MRNWGVLTGLLMLLSIGTAQAGQKNDWAYPLELTGAGLSSNFGEFRGNRVHTGIDFKTNMQTGYKVFAIDGGTITRLSVKKLGFGNAIYIEHPNGLMSVYGHLERFSDKELGVQRVVEQYRKKRGTKYPGDISVNIPVKKGQLIAYSGETGYGLPHLHLEVRRGGATPIDPFEHGFSYNDTIAPTIESLAIEPVGAESFVNGEHTFQEFSLKKTGDTFTTPQIPKVSGKVRFTASAFDQIGAENRCAVDEIDLYIAASGVDQTDLFIDEHHLFHNQFDVVTYDTNQRGGLVYDYNMTRLSNPTHYYYRLYMLSSALFPYRKAFAKQDGVWDTTTAPAGLHTLILQMRDATGNLSAAQMQVEVVKDAAATFAQTPVKLPQDSTWQAELREFDGFIEITLLTAAPLSAEPALTLRPQNGAAKTLAMTQAQPGDYRAAYPLSAKEAGVLIIELAAAHNGEQIAQRWEFPVNPIAAKQGGAVRYGDAATMTIPAGALYQNVFANIWPTTAYKPQDGLPLKSEVFDFRPTGAPFDAQGKVSIRYAADVKSPHKLGVYWWDNIKERWYYMDDELNPAKRTVSANIIYPSIYAVLQDNLDPAITEFSPESGGTASNVAKVWAKIEDTGKGVNESSIVMTLDGKRVDGEFDPDRSRYTYQLTKNLASGKHTVTVQASDKAGNPATPQTATFTIK